MENEDLFKGIGAFLMCFGAGLPLELKTRIHQRTHELADEMQAAGDTMPATVARELADALLALQARH